MAKKPIQISPIQWAATWLEQDTEVVMRFLATPLDQLDEHASYAAYIHGKYGAMLTDLEEAHEALKDERTTFEAGLIADICETINPNTKSPYSVAYAQRKIGENKKLTSLKQQERAAKYKALKVKRYVRSLEMKANSIPGKQGLYNRTLNLEENTET